MAIKWGINNLHSYNYQEFIFLIKLAKLPFSDFDRSTRAILLFGTILLWFCLSDHNRAEFNIQSVLHTSICWYLRVLPVLHRPEVVDNGVNTI